MLLHSDRGMSDVALAAFLLCSEDIVRRARVRYLTERLNAALEDKPHPRQASLLTPKAAFVIELGGGVKLSTRSIPDLASLRGGAGSLPKPLSWNAVSKSSLVYVSEEKFARCPVSRHPAQRHCMSREQEFVAGKHSQFCAVQ
jgi:hypothetical protein